MGLVLSETMDYLYQQVTNNGVLLTPLQCKSCLYPSPLTGKLSYTTNIHTAGTRGFSYNGP